MNRFSFNKLSTRTKGSVGAGVFTGLAFVIAIGIILVIWYILFPSIKTTQQNIANAKADISNLKTKISEVSAAKKILERISPYLYKLDLAMPTNDQFSESIVSANQIAIDSGLSALDNFSLGKPIENTKDYQAIPISVDATGSYESLIAFLTNIDKNLRLVHFETVTVSPEENEEGVAQNSLTFNLGGSVYAKVKTESSTTASDTADASGQAQTATPLSTATSGYKTNTTVPQ